MTKLKNMKLSLKLGVVFVTFFLLNAGSLLLASPVISSMQSDAAIINLSGMQRMNAEKIYRLAQQLSADVPEERDELLRVIQKFDHNLQILTYGNETIRSSVQSLESASFLNEKVSRSWAEMHALLDELLYESSVKDSAVLKSSIQSIYDLLSFDINRYVTIVQHQSDAKVEHLKRIGLIILLLNLLIVAVATWAVMTFILRPLSRLIRMMDKVADGHYRLPLLVVDRDDEVGQLSKSFNTMLQNLMIRKEVMKTGDFQRKLVPSEFENDWVQVSMIYEPQQFVSGDFIDYVWDEQRKRLYGFVIDIMGHGMTPALQACAIRVLLRQGSHREEPLHERLARVNNETVQYFSEDTFAAVISFELDVETGRLSITSGGINHFISYEEGSISLVKTPGGYVGLLENCSYEQQIVTLNAEAGVIFASDGLLELTTMDRDDCNSFEQYVTALRRLAKQGTNRDDASAICIYLRRPTNSKSE
ncbi:PP2C family protein-serine/threonine phosphatase [Cohnella sp. WQ 127256]|uniref:PP2C family protein-serine/threonine phosphatase n=1 Tax=Cohnella sp. WQ 127256 TaxID=2938790 RepID=UPI0021199520|nr:SpoIIE family protein phosphatase [Cohnella sp. WQ 127256]